MLQISCPIGNCLADFEDGFTMVIPKRESYQAGAKEQQDIPALFGILILKMQGMELRK